MNNRVAFLPAFLASHRMALRMLLALPAVAVALIGIELVQHAVEWRIGMFDSLVAAQATELHPARIALGTIKLVILNVIGFVAIRFAWSGGDAAFAMRPSRRALLLFAPVIGFELAFAALDRFLVPTEHAITSMIVGMALMPFLFRWMAGAAIGRFVDPRRSASAMLPHLPWAFAFTLASMLPLMVVHYALFFATIGQPPAVAGALLFLDALVVGWLGPMLAVAQLATALRAGPLEEVRAAAA